MGRNIYPKEETQLQTPPRYKRPRREIVCRDIRKEVWCTSCKIKGHIVSKCPEIKKLEKQCAILSATMTDDQLTKFQEVINYIFGNDYIDDSQLLQALELVLEILEVIIDSKNEEAVPNVYKADIASTIISENKSPKCLAPTPEVLSIKSQYNKLTTEDHDAYYTSVQKFVLKERLKKGTVVKMDKNKGNIEGDLKAKARLELCYKNKRRAKKIYDQKLDQVLDTNIRNQPKPDKQSRPGWYSQYSSRNTKDKHKAFVLYQILTERSDANGTHKAKYCYPNDSSITDTSIVDEVNRVKLAFKGSIKNTREIKVKRNALGIEAQEKKYRNDITIKKKVLDRKPAKINYVDEIEVKSDYHKTFTSYQKPQEISFQIGNESGYEKIAPNPISSYLEEPENADDDAETWYPCNDEIPEDWLGLNDSKKAQISQNNYLLNGIRVEQDEYRASTKYQKPTKIDRTSRTCNSYQDSIKSSNDRSKTKGRIGPKHFEKAKTKNNWKTKTPNRRKRKRADKLSKLENRPTVSEYNQRSAMINCVRIINNLGNSKKSKVEKDNYDESIYHRKSAIRECAPCNEDKVCPVWCLLCDLDVATRWMSRNKDIDGCIREFQLRVWKYENAIK
ncbi:hypothetical protein C2G38_2202951 [Gigaspora rosea]|uniref:Uncharacterized protein n=1 Tax=Gigaspora rosea TaxID=44941 RepID=A0A397UQL4_9GLOM|nr:hypothetical protein C2G38_2202951 [Gigaspora rosea]